MFRDTKGRVDDLLKELGVRYRLINFDFRCIGYKDIAHINRLFPDIIKGTYFNRELCSFTTFRMDENGDITNGADPDCVELLEGFLQKIPRPINPGFNTVILDLIDWYNDGKQNPVYYLVNGEISQDHLCSSYYSNSIRLRKEFDFGNKYNPVTLMIDRTDDSVDTIREYPEAFLKVMNALGKPKYTDLRCTFDPEEKARNKIAEKEVMEAVQTNTYSDAYKEFEGMINAENELYYGCTPIKGISPKEIIGKIAKQYGYKYTSFWGGAYTYKKIIENNYIVIVDFVGGPGSSAMGANVRVEGYNFWQHLFTGEEIPVCDSDLLEKYSKVTFGTADKAIEDYFDLFNERFGKTPRWFADRK